MKQSIFKFFFAAVVAMVSVCNSFAQECPPNNEIWYTTQNGSAVWPEGDMGTESEKAKIQTVNFGTTINSNTYTNGKGIIKFNGQITKIGGFSAKTIITSITMPNSVTYIGNNAFSGCSSLTSINMPYSVIKIGAGAFKECSNLKTVNISSLESWCKIKFGDEYSNPVRYSHYFCIDNVIQGDLVIPSTVDTIRAYAFEGYTNMYTFTIPKSVICIEKYAFRECNNLYNIALPHSITDIGEGAFSNCKNLNIVLLPKPLVYLGDNAFSNCTKMTSVSIEKRLKYLGAGAFANCENLTSIKLPTTLETIGSEAFFACSQLRTINIPTSVNEIGINAFKWCESLPVVDNIRYADTYLVEAVDKTLSTYSIKENIRWIGNQAFEDCSNLKSFKVPSSVYRIDYSTFANCNNLETVELPENLTTIYRSAFYKCINLKTINIPSSLESIGNLAFYGCSNLETDIKLPNSVKEIGESAFMNCSKIKTIVLPDSLTKLADYAFQNCSNLFSVTIGKSLGIGDLGSKTPFGYKCFDGCTGIKQLIYAEGTECIYGSGITSINTVFIPNSVKVIRMNAFYDCNNLTSITNLAKQPQSISDDCFSNYNATLHVCEGYKNIYQNTNVWKKFTIKDDIGVLATSIKIDTCTYYCGLYNFITFTATVNSEATNKNVQWESSDRSILTFIDATTGRAMGIKNGSVTIIASTVDGSNLSDTATVYVSEFSAIEENDVNDIDVNNTPSTISPVNASPPLRKVKSIFKTVRRYSSKYI